MQNLTPEGLRIVTDAARRHGVSVEAAIALLGALADGHGGQAQFDHPELGGMGQWSRGGMIMIGDMFNSGLKARVDALCNELASFVVSQPPAGAEAGGFQSQCQGGGVSLFVRGQWHGRRMVAGGTRQSGFDRRAERSQIRLLSRLAAARDPARVACQRL